MKIKIEQHNVLEELSLAAVTYESMDGTAKKKKKRELYIIPTSQIVDSQRNNGMHAIGFG